MGGASRKRAFLGQIGVCTVDQVLLSVLPVRHQFVRAFGLRKSVLIIDEVHAYDAYMYGLLTQVLQGQQRAGGSAMLLSATLPLAQKSTLVGRGASNLKREKQRKKHLTRSLPGSHPPVSSKPCAYLRKKCQLHAKYVFPMHVGMNRLSSGRLGDGSS